MNSNFQKASRMLLVAVLLGLLSVQAAGDNLMLQEGSSILVPQNASNDNTLAIPLFMNTAQKTPRHLSFTFIFNESAPQDGRPVLKATGSTAKYVKGASNAFNYYESSKGDSYNPADPTTITDADRLSTVTYSGSRFYDVRFNNFYFNPNPSFLELQLNGVQKPFVLLNHDSTLNVLPVNDAFIGTTPDSQTFTKYQIYIPWDFYPTTTTVGTKVTTPTYKLLTTFNHLKGTCEFRVYTDYQRFKSEYLSEGSGDLMFYLNTDSKSKPIVFSNVNKTSNTQVYIKVVSWQGGECSYRIASQLVPTEKYVAKNIFDITNDERKITCYQNTVKTISCSWPDSKFGNLTTYNVYLTSSPSRDQSMSTIEADTVAYVDAKLVESTVSTPSVQSKFPVVTPATQPNQTMFIEKSVNATSTTFEGLVVGKSYKVIVVESVRWGSWQPLVVRMMSEKFDFTTKAGTKPTGTTTPTNTGTTETNTGETGTNTKPSSGGSSIFTWILILGVIGGGYWFYKKKQAENEANNNRQQDDRTVPLLERREGGNPGQSA